MEWSFSSKDRSYKTGLFLNQAFTLSRHLAAASGLG